MDNKDIIKNIKELIKSSFDDLLPFYLKETPFKEFLITVAKNNNKFHSAALKNHIPLAIAKDIINELSKSDIITIIKSREKPFKSSSKQKIKKEYRDYEIEDKILFTKPIYRFWFGFIEPFRDKDGKIKVAKVIKEYQKNAHKLISFTFEELSIDLLEQYFNYKFDSCYSYWDYFNEFDIYCQYKDQKIVGECKYTSRVVTKNELIKLKKKLIVSNLGYDYIALFSKSGFSNELKKEEETNLLLFELKDYKRLLI